MVPRKERPQVIGLGTVYHHYGLSARCWIINVLVSCLRHFGCTNQLQYRKHQHHQETLRILGNALLHFSKWQHAVMCRFSQSVARRSVSFRRPTASLSQSTRRFNSGRIWVEHEIIWNANLMQQGNFINVFFAQHVSGTYTHNQEH